MFGCSPTCGCGGGCAAGGTYMLEGAVFSATGGVCRCGFDDPPPYDPQTHEPTEGAGFSISFSDPAVIFEEAYQDSDEFKSATIRRIALIRELPLSVQDYGERLIDDICAISNREERVALMDRFAQEVRDLPTSNLDLRSRARELSRCRLLTEKACDGYRRLKGHEVAIWNLRLALLARYVSTTNEYHAEWGRFDARKKTKHPQKSATVRCTYMGSGSRLSGWIKSIEGDLNHYLLEIEKWLYRVDSHGLSRGARLKVKDDIEQTVGRSLDFVEPRD